MAAETLVALIAAGATVVGAFIAWLSAHRIEKLKGDIAKDAAAHTSSLHVMSERQIEIFRLACADIQEAAKCLVDWRDALKDYSAFTSTKGGEAWETMGEGMRAIARAAEKIGLLLPPELDRPYLDALNALNAGTEAISGHSILLGLKYDDQKTISKHFRGKEAADAAVKEFLRLARGWKAEQWPLREAKADVAREAEKPVTRTRVATPTEAHTQSEDTEEDLAEAEEQHQEGRR